MKIKIFVYIFFNYLLFINWFVNFKTHKKIITNIIIYSNIAVLYLMDLRQRGFLFRKFFLLLKTRTKNIIASSRRSRTVDGGEVISEVEAQIKCIH